MKCNQQKRVSQDCFYKLCISAVTGGNRKEWFQMVQSRALKN